MPSHPLGGPAILDHTPGTQGILLSVNSLVIVESHPEAVGVQMSVKDSTASHPDHIIILG